MSRPRPPRRATSGSLRSDRRGQSFTIEAVVAAVILLGTVFFVVQAGGVTPTTASTSSQEVPDHHRAVAAGALDAALRDGEVRPTLRYWNETNGTFWGAEEHGAYVAGGPPTAFGDRLNESFSGLSVAYNVNLVVVDADGDQRRHALVQQGTPSDDAVTVSRLVTLYDRDALYDEYGHETNVTLKETSDDANMTYFVDDASPASPVFAVVRVEVVVWPV